MEKQKVKANLCPKIIADVLDRLGKTQQQPEITPSLLKFLEVGTMMQGKKISKQAQTQEALNIQVICQLVIKNVKFYIIFSDYENFAFKYFTCSSVLYIFFVRDVRFSFGQKCALFYSDDPMF